MSTTITHKDELVYAGTGGGSNRHRPVLHLEKDGQFHEFKGASIPGVCRVIRDDYKKNGKWSFSTWTIQLADGVQAWTNAGGRVADLSGLCALTSPLTMAATWADVPEPLRRVVRSIYPNNAQRLNEADAPILLFAGDRGLGGQAGDAGGLGEAPADLAEAGLAPQLGQGPAGRVVQRGARLVRVLRSVPQRVAAAGEERPRRRGGLEGAEGSRGLGARVDEVGIRWRRGG